ncbi:MAG TPA: YjbH domain-containing protein, partial [Alphaproteobacteria bacterium]
MRTVLLLSAILFCLPAIARAQETYTANIWGEPGLLTVPSARMYEPGTVVMHAGTLDPYFHGAFGLQVTDGLYVALRQTANTSSLRDPADRLYPGIDLRLRLLKEGKVVPETTIGLRSAFGHKRTASEYLALSKRFGDFDLTGGMAWGRMGSAGNLGNPLKIFGNHFGGNRPLDGEMPTGTDDWFTGNDVGLFAGVEYFPLGQPFSIKADWNADDYAVEDARPGFDPPPRWSFGMAFRPTSWMNFSVGMAGFEKILGTLTLRPSLQKWKWRSVERKPAESINPYRTGMALPGQMANSAAKEGITLYHAESDDLRASTMMELSQNGESLPYQAGRAMRHMANNGGETVEKLSVIPTYMGLRGPEISLMRRDLEQALARQQGSPQEIWRNVTFDDATPARGAYLPVAAARRYRAILDSQISLSEEDRGLLYRTGLVFDARQNIGRHFMLGGAIRLNLKDNLTQLNQFRPRAILPVRSDVDVFAARRLAVDRSFLGWLATPKTGLHVGLAAG